MFLNFMKNEIINSQTKNYTMKKLLFIILLLTPILYDMSYAQNSKKAFIPLSKFNKDTVAFIKANYGDVCYRYPNQKIELLFKDADGELPFKSFYITSDGTELLYLVLFFYTPKEIKERLANGMEVYSITCVLQDIISIKENSSTYDKLTKFGFDKLCKMDNSLREIINKFTIEFVVYENRTQTMKKMLKL